MSKGFDFNKKKNRFFPVTLDKETGTLLVQLPNKALRDELIDMKDELEGAEDAEEEIEDMVYELSAKLISRNKNGVEVTEGKLRELYDMEMMVEFLGAYAEFLNEQISSKN